MGPLSMFVVTYCGGERLVRPSWQEVGAYSALVIENNPAKLLVTFEPFDPLFPTFGSSPLVSEVGYDIG